jgi:hypothetical protein
MIKQTRAFGCRVAGNRRGRFLPTLCMPSSGGVMRGLAASAATPSGHGDRNSEARPVGARSSVRQTQTAHWQSGAFADSPANLRCIRRAPAAAPKHRMAPGQARRYDRLPGRRKERRRHGTCDAMVDTAKGRWRMPAGRKCAYHEFRKARPQPVSPHPASCRSGLGESSAVNSRRVK